MGFQKIYFEEVSNGREYLFKITGIRIHIYHAFGTHIDNLPDISRK
jgi:hypothetical protein